MFLQRPQRLNQKVTSLLFLLSLVQVQIEEHHWSNYFYELFFFLFFAHLEELNLLTNIVNILHNFNVLFTKQIYLWFGGRHDTGRLLHIVVRYLHSRLHIRLGKVNCLFWDYILLPAILSWFSFDFVQEIDSALLKIFVFENGDLFFLTNFVEVVHVELANEGGKFAMLKVLGENLFHEFLLVLDNEAVPFIRPLHDDTIPLIL